MFGCYWGENSPNAPQNRGNSAAARKPAENRWTLRTIPVSRIAYGHKPDRRGERTDKYGREPIHVRSSMWGGLVVQDGNDRLYYARQRGRSHIWAWVRNG
jgi:hypothetical protein